MDQFPMGNRSENGSVRCRRGAFGDGSCSIVVGDGRVCSAIARTVPAWRSATNNVSRLSSMHTEHGTVGALRSCQTSRLWEITGSSPRAPPPSQLGGGAYNEYL